MSREPHVGVIGGYGAVGGFLAGQLDRRGGLRLRIGGRSPEAAAQFVDRQLVGRAEPLVVDVTDAASLAAFCEGCDVVVNCGGPAHRIGARVGLAARRARAGYVDVAGDLALREALTADATGVGWVGVLAAGAMPGLSELLPRLLATESEDWRERQLTVFVGGRDHFTATAAADYVAGSSGARALDAPAPDLPVFFGSTATAFPVVGELTERMQQRIVDPVRWFAVFDGRRVLAALGRAGGRPLDEVVPEVVRAAELDAFGRTPYHCVVVTLAGRCGTDGARTERRHLVVRAANASALTGAMGAICTTALIEERIPAGVHFAAEVLATAEVLDQLRALPAMWVEDLPAPAGGADVHEGVL